MIYLFRQLAPKKHSKFHLHVFGYPPEMQLTVEQKPQIAYQASQHFQKKFEWQVPTGISQILWQSIRSCHDKFQRSNALLQRGRNLQFPTSTKCGTQHEFPLPETGHNWLASTYSPAKTKTGNRKVKGQWGVGEDTPSSSILPPRTSFTSLPVLAGKLQLSECFHTDFLTLCHLTLLIKKALATIIPGKAAYNYLLFGIS